MTSESKNWLGFINSRYVEQRCGARDPKDRLCRGFMSWCSRLCIVPLIMHLQPLHMHHITWPMH